MEQLFSQKLSGALRVKKRSSISFFFFTHLTKALASTSKARPAINAKAVPRPPGPCLRTRTKQMMG
jgi:hypothetical protein